MQRENDIVVQGFKEYILPTFDGATVPQTPQLPAATPSELGSIAYQPCTPEYFTPGQVQDGQSMLAYYDCLCRYYPEEALAQGINCQTFTEIYWYHPDYLGNTEFITDAGGYPYQFFYYSAFGESLVQQNANTGSFATPYKFNAKELDLETGNYYYGARYYNPQTSIWFGVDPLASRYPGFNPYNYVNGNPIMYRDPDGKNPLLGAILGALTEYIAIVGQKMIFEGLTFQKANNDLDLRNSIDIIAAGVMGAASGAIDGGISKFIVWVGSPKNRKLIEVLARAGIDAFEEAVKGLLDPEQAEMFDLESILVAAGLGYLIPTRSETLKKQTAQSNSIYNNSRRRAAELANRQNPHERLVQNANQQVQNARSMNTMLHTVDRTVETGAKTVKKEVEEVIKDECN